MASCKKLRAKWASAGPGSYRLMTPVPRGYRKERGRLRGLAPPKITVYAVHKEPTVTAVGFAV